VITRAGTVLGGRYALIERIAIGGMGEVWRGVDTEMDRPVAVKVLRDDLDGDGPFLARFREEARTARMLDHPGIAATYDFREEQGLAYLVMELVPGQSLATILARDGALGTGRTVNLLAQTARALHAAHERGVVHRDVKPANILVTPDERACVTDFGIARPEDHEPLTATGQVMGTAHYLAPEVAQGQTATASSDVYALGVVAYECLAGRRPFEGVNQVAVATAHLHDQPPPLPETIPLGVRSLVAQVMAKEPANRPASALALAEALEALAAHPERLPMVPTASAVRRLTPSPAPRAPGAPPTSDLTARTPARGRGRDARTLVRGPRRSMRSPLLALVGLVSLVVLGALWSAGKDRGLVENAPVRPAAVSAVGAIGPEARLAGRNLPRDRRDVGTDRSGELRPMLGNGRDKGWSR
jgi:serine/threonine-protein kinase